MSIAEHVAYRWLTGSTNMVNALHSLVRHLRQDTLAWSYLSGTPLNKSLQHNDPRDVFVSIPASNNTTKHDPTSLFMSIQWDAGNRVFREVGYVTVSGRRASFPGGPWSLQGEATDHLADCLESILLPKVLAESLE